MSMQRRHDRRYPTPRLSRPPNGLPSSARAGSRTTNGAAGRTGWRPTGPGWKRSATAWPSRARRRRPPARPCTPPASSVTESSGANCSRRWLWRRSSWRWPASCWPTAATAGPGRTRAVEGTRLLPVLGRHRRVRGLVRRRGGLARAVVAGRSVVVRAAGDLCLPGRPAGMGAVYRFRQRVCRHRSAVPLPWPSHAGGGALGVT